MWEGSSTEVSSWYPKSARWASFTPCGDVHRGWMLDVWKCLRAYQDGYWLVTLHTHGDYWEIRSPAPWPTIPFTLSRHWANHSMPYPNNVEHQARKQQELSHWFDSTLNRTPVLPYHMQGLCCTDLTTAPSKRWGGWGCASKCYLAQTKTRFNKLKTPVWMWNWGNDWVHWLAWRNARQKIPHLRMVHK